MSRLSEEKRKSKRSLYVRPVSFKAMDGHPSPGEILDLSDGGARIRTAVPPHDNGTVVQAWIPMTELQIPVPVLGLVRWMRKERQEVYQIGVQFLL